MFIAGPRLSHKRLKPLCTSGSSAALTCSFGGTLLSFIATYWPTHNSAASGSLWTRMLNSTNINPITQLKAAIAAHLDDNPDRTHIIGGDFNTDVTAADQYGLEDYMATHRLEHVSSESDLYIKSYIRPGARVATRLDYQLIRTNTIEAYSCAPIDDYPGTSGHRPLLGRYKLHCAPIPTPHKFIAPMKYRDIKLNQKEKIGDLIGLLEEIDLAPGLDPGARLLYLEETIVERAHRIFKPKANRSKAGWSPRIRAITISLQMIVRIKRHVFGHHHYFNGLNLPFVRASITSLKLGALRWRTTRTWGPRG